MKRVQRRRRRPHTSRARALAWLTCAAGLAVATAAAAPAAHGGEPSATSSATTPATTPAAHRPDTPPRVEPTSAGPAPVAMPSVDPGLSPELARQAAELRERGATADQVLAALEIEAPRSCLDFSSRTALLERKRRWGEAVGVLSVTHPDELLGWIVGRTPPPRVARREAELQKDCLLTAMVEAIPSTDLNLRIVLDYPGAFAGEITSPRQLARRWHEGNAWRRRIIHNATRSGYRNAASQSQIWMRKYLFEGRSFNIVSEHAATKCGIGAAQTWKPGASRHVRCWRTELTPEERVREILHASAAPGISRHHWGTEFDLFSLNPVSFVSGGPLAGDYVWMTRHALDHGYFQPFTDGLPPGTVGHMEERWHWSYYPIAQALYEYAARNDQEVERAVHAQWDEMEARYNRRRREPVEFFAYIRTSWRDYLFNVDVPHIEPELEPATEPEFEARTDMPPADSPKL